jgi:phage shock protein PspC (stress-responsive transcriptional regulator)
LTDTTFPSRRIDNLFVGAPTSFEWHRLLATNPVAGDIAGLAWYNKISAFMVSLWVTIIFLLMIGFAYSYYFSAFTMVYLLMRRKVDDTEIDEVYLEEDEPEEPLLPPAAPAAPPPSGTAQPLQMVDAPALRTPPPAGDGNAAAPPPAAPAPAPPPAEGTPPVG